MAAAGDSAQVPESIAFFVVADTLGLTPPQLAAMNAPDVQVWLSYTQGKQVGQWAQQHNGKDDNNG